MPSAPPLKKNFTATKVFDGDFPKANGALKDRIVRSQKLDTTYGNLLLDELNVQRDICASTITEEVSGISLSDDSFNCTRDNTKDLIMDMERRKNCNERPRLSMIDYDAQSTPCLPVDGMKDNNKTKNDDEKLKACETNDVNYLASRTT